MEIKTLIKQFFCKHEGSVSKYNFKQKWVAIYECNKCDKKILLK